jgi:glycolate oxidase iron-sulfur subunit
LRPVLPQKLKAKIPVRPMKMMPVFPQAEHGRKVLLIEGCVQPSLSPEIDVATAQVLDKLGVQTLRTGQVQCCGAVENHLQAKDAGLNRVRANIDAWLPYLDEVEAILSTASACALEIKEYGYMLRNDTAYAEKAAFVSSMAKDLVEVLMHENLDAFRVQGHKRISFHAPCTLQHGQKLNGSVEAVLGRVGFELETVQDSHLCCGSAGTYSILEPELSLTLRDNKVAHLNASSPELIATANIGCLHHMQAGTATPVKHWVTLLADLENDTKVQNV